MQLILVDNPLGLDHLISYLLPSYIDFANYSAFLDLTFGLVDDTHPDFLKITEQKISYLNDLLQPLKEKYDCIFIDVPPTKSYITDSAVIASNYVLIVLQTQELSLDSAIEYLKDLQLLTATYKSNFEIVDILPVLMAGNASLDKFVLDNATSIFGEENIFTTKIPNMARLKRFDNTGITNYDYDRHDKKVITLYGNVANELIERINYFEGIKEND